LAVLLRILAGASCIDLQHVLRIGRSTFFSVFHSTICAFLSTLKMPGVPVDDSLKMRELAEALRTSRVAPNPLWGCIGAFDGKALPMQKPLDKYFQGTNLHEKYFYSLPIQAICDPSYRFLHMPARCVGSTHDSLAWACSILGSRFYNGLNIGEYWIAGDAAYL
jgi:hypothetical protein